jgi:uncharacterized protein (DUF1684 family)
MTHDAQVTRDAWSRVKTLAAAVAVVAAGCTSGPPPPDRRPYEQQVMSERAAKDEFFRTSESPIPAAQRATFAGLVYYPVNPAYRVPASLREDATGPRTTISLPTSTNDVRQMLKIGTLAFTLEGQAYALTAFAENARVLDRLFVPFGDLTNRGETYGGGRYLDLDRTATGVYDLDFNRAYHPYCVYDPTYDCPVPPRENRLPLSIPAGERLAP